MLVIKNRRRNKVVNIQIKTLSKQAYLWAVEQSRTEKHHCKLGSDYFLALQQKRFAELLIRQCAKVANDSNQSKNRPVGVSVGDVVEEFFGVK